MAKKKASPSENNNDVVLKEELKQELKTIDFSFNDKEIVIITGTDDKRFAMSPNKKYKVIWKVAKLLISKGAAKLAE